MIILEYADTYPLVGRNLTELTDVDIVQILHANRLFTSLVIGLSSHLDGDIQIAEFLDGFIAQATSFLPPELDADRQLVQVIAAGRLGKRGKQELHVRLPGMSFRKIDLMTCTHGPCVAVDACELHTVHATDHLAPCIGIDDLIESEAFLRFTQERTGHTLAFDVDSGLIIKVVKLVVVETEFSVSYPDIGRLPVENGIGIEDIDADLGSPAIGVQLLVATDVAARGLDVDDLTHVINYGLPDDTESYTHRSGRTGRAGKTGTSIAIINLREKGKMREIERIIAKKFETGVMPTAKQICEKQLMKVIDDLEKVKVNEEEIADFMPDVCRKLDWLSKEDLIKRMVSHEFNRFVEYYRDREEIETVGTNEEKKAGKGKKNGSRKAEAGFTRLFINVGKTDNFFPTDLIGLINSNTKGRVDLGRIDLMRNFSFFEVDEAEADKVIKALNRTRWNGRRISVEPAGEVDENTGRKKAERKTEKPERKKAEKPAKEPRRAKPSREERGYTKPRGRKDDWKQFFQHDNGLKGPEPDFSEEGWAKPSKKKKK